MALKQRARDMAARKLDNSGDEEARLGRKKMREVARFACGSAKMLGLLGSSQYTTKQTKTIFKT